MSPRTRVVLVGGDASRRRRPAWPAEFTVTATVRSLADRRCRDADLILLDVDIDIDRDAAELMLLSGSPDLPPVLVTGASLLRPDIWMARGAGARGYLASTEDPLPALRAVRDTGRHWPAGLGAQPAWLAEPDPLLRFAAFTRERERARYARLLHDTVLQTLEGLALSGTVADPAVRSLLAHEAASLRAFIAPSPTAATGLAGSLSALAREFRARGLRISLRVHGRPAPGASAVQALTGAAREALRNVVKHAGTDRATVTVTARDGRVAVRIADRGRGFDPAGTAAGFGRTESIEARLAAVGGTAGVTGVPGRGTVVELVVPARASRPAGQAGRTASQEAGRLRRTSTAPKTDGSWAP